LRSVHLTTEAHATLLQGFRSVPALVTHRL